MGDLEPAREAVDGGAEFSTGEAGFGEASWGGESGFKSEEGRAVPFVLDDVFSVTAGSAGKSASSVEDTSAESFKSASWVNGGEGGVK